MRRPVAGIEAAVCDELPRPTLLLDLTTMENARLPMLRRLKRRAGAIVSSAGSVVAVALLVLASAASVAIPAGLGILSLESERAKRGLRSARRFLLRRKPTTGATG